MIDVEKGALSPLEEHVLAVPLKRLQVQPWARYSVRYQEMVDQGLLTQDLPARSPGDVSDPLEGGLEDDDWDDDDDDDDEAPAAEEERAV